MDKEPKIKLKSENSEYGASGKLDEISNQDTSPNDHRKIKLNNLFLPFAICMLIGIWVGFGLLSSGFSGGMFVSYNQGAGASASKASTKAGSSSSKASTSISAKNSSSTSSKSKTAKAADEESSNKSSNDDKKHEYVNNTVGNSVSNTLNGGFLGEEDDWFYYIDSNNKDNVYRTNYKSSATELIFNVPSSGINIFKNKLYAKQTNMEFFINQMEIDKNFSSYSHVGCDYINVLPDCVITSNNEAIYHMRQDGDVDYITALYYGEITSCATFNNTIYSIQYDSLFQMDTSGKNKKLVKENVHAFTVGDFGLYYISDNKLYHDGNSSPLFGISLSSLNIHDGVLYFGNLNDNNKLYSINLDGSNCQKISDVKAEKICVTKHKIAIKNGNIVTLI